MDKIVTDCVICGEKLTDKSMKQYQAIKHAEMAGKQFFLLKKETCDGNQAPDR